MITGEVVGLAELKRQLLSLPKKFDKPVLHAALMAGARLIRDEARARVPVDTGTLRRNITAKRLKSRQYTASVAVSARRYSRKQAKRRREKGKDVDDPFYWFMVEFGTSKMAPRPYLRPAFESKKIAALGAITVAMRERLQKEARKMGFTVR